MRRTIAAAQVTRNETIHFENQFRRVKSYFIVCDDDFFFAAVAATLVPFTSKNVITGLIR